jgi:MFS transporter, ACS family, glucarate transporter
MNDSLNRAPAVNQGARGGVEAAAMTATRVRWRIVWLMAIGALVSYVLRLNMSIAGEAMVRDLSLTPVQFGLILSAFAWGYAIFQVPGGVFGEVLGPRRALTIAIAAWGVITLATAAIPGATAPAVIVGVAMLLRFLMGAAQAPIFPVTAGCSIRAWFPMRAWAMPNALIAVGATLGGVVAGPVVAWMVVHLGWRGSFVAMAPLGFIGAILWWVYSRDDPEQHPQVNAAELDLIRSDRPPPAAVERGAWRAVLTERNVLLLTASYFCMSYVFYLFFNWFFFYLTDVRGFDAQVSGWFTGLQWGIGAVASLAGGTICDLLSRRHGAQLGARITALVGLLACAGLMVAGAAVSRPLLAVMLLSLSFGFVMLADVAYWVAAMIAGGRHAAAATGLMNTGGNVVGALGAVAVPLIAGAFGWFAAVASGAVFALLGAALWLFVKLPGPVVATLPRPLVVAGGGSLEDQR